MKSNKIMLIGAITNVVLITFLGAFLTNKKEPENKIISKINIKEISCIQDNSNEYMEANNKLEINFENDKAKSYINNYFLNLVDENTIENFNSIKDSYNNLIDSYENIDGISIIKVINEDNKFEASINFDLSKTENSIISYDTNYMDALNILKENNYICNE